MGSAAKSTEHGVQICCGAVGAFVAAIASIGRRNKTQRLQWKRAPETSCLGAWLIFLHKIHFIIMVPVNGDGLGTRARDILHQNPRVLRAPS